MTEKRYFEMVFRYLFSIAQDSVLKNYSGKSPINPDIHLVKSWGMELFTLYRVQLLKKLFVNLLFCEVEFVFKFLFENVKNSGENVIVINENIALVFFISVVPTI